MVRELLQNIRDYLSGHIAVQDLESWLLSNLQGILDSGDEMAIDIANQLDADLVEFGEDLIDEATFRDHLETYVRISETISIYVPDIQPLVVIYGTAAVETIKAQLEVRPVVDLRVAHQFA